VASAYGWVTIAILSMVKRAHPLYSNRPHLEKSLGQASINKEAPNSFGHTHSLTQKMVCKSKEELWQQLGRKSKE
jgi:hypothetical protein